MFNILTRLLSVLFKNRIDGTMFDNLKDLEIKLTSFDRLRLSTNSNCANGNVPCSSHKSNRALARNLRAPILEVKIKATARSVRGGWKGHTRRKGIKRLASYSALHICDSTRKLPV